jgi:hypothetical protein
LVNGSPVQTTGLVESTFARDGQQFVRVGGKEIPLSGIVAVSLTPA